MARVAEAQPGLDRTDIFFREMLSRLGGGLLSGSYLHYESRRAPEAVQVVGEKAAETWNRLQPILDAQVSDFPFDAAEHTSLLKEHANLVFDYATRLRMPQTPDLVMGGAVGALLLADSFFTAERARIAGVNVEFTEPDQFGWGHAGWEGFKAACAVATPALLHGLFTSLSVDPSLQSHLASFEFLTEGAITATLAAIGLGQIVTSGVRMGRVAFDVWQERQEKKLVIKQAQQEAQRQAREQKRQMYRDGLAAMQADYQMPGTPRLLIDIPQEVLESNADAGFPSNDNEHKPAFTDEAQIEGYGNHVIRKIKRGSKRIRGLFSDWRAQKARRKLLRMRS